MNIIYTEREDIINNSNFAQEQFDSILDTIDSPNISELRISTPLQGNLDLTILSKDKYSKIKKLVFNEGQITKLSNIPKHINSLECKRNLLVHLDDFPKQLNYLDIDYNYLTKLDIYNSNIEILHCNNNKITELKLNPKLEEVYCENNDLKFLDIKDLVNLQTLHVSNNPLLVLKNKDSINITDFEGENNPLLNLSVSPLIVDPNIEQHEVEEQLESKINYLEAVEQYFKLKAQYERKVKNDKRKVLEITVSEIRNNKTIKSMRQKLQRFKPKCILCNRSGGTIFSRKDGYYTAICGSAQPCKLNIKIFKGIFDNKEIMINLYREEIEKHKDNIIKQKLDTLLNYISEEQSAKIFQEKVEIYKDDNVVYKELLDTYDDTFYNKNRKEALDTKIKDEINTIQDDIKKLIIEYKDTKNSEILKTAIDTYVNKLVPETENVRNLKYDVCEIEHVEKNKEPTLDILHQFHVGFDKLEICYGEQPSVESFVMKI